MTSLNRRAALPGRAVKVTYFDTLELARANGVAPRRCARCGLTPRWGLSWNDAHDDGQDPHWLGYECRNCGHVQGLTRATILRRIRESR